MPRYYSLGSSASEGFLEMSVRRLPGGLCSGLLHDLQPGETVPAFLRPNPEFHLRPGKAPVILVGSGCGMGVLAGFVRANRDRRPMRLYYGTRDPGGDFLYRAEMRDWMAGGRLAARVLAATGTAGEELQDRIAADRDVLTDAIGTGARVMVVSGRDKAEAVRRAFDDAVEALGLTVADLMAEGRYVEDVF